MDVLRESTQNSQRKRKMREVMNGHNGIESLDYQTSLLVNMRTKKVPWGPVGLCTYKRTYARRLR